jgi:hypothetical protein
MQGREDGSGPQQLCVTAYLIYSHFNKTELVFYYLTPVALHIPAFQIGLE